MVHHRPDATLIAYVEEPGFDPLWRAIVLFGFDAGAEPQEFLGVQVRDVNVVAGTVHLQRTCSEAGGEIIVSSEMKAPKRNRILPLAPRRSRQWRPLPGP